MVVISRTTSHLHFRELLLFIKLPLLSPDQRIVTPNAKFACVTEHSPLAVERLSSLSRSCKIGRFLVHHCLAFSLLNDLQFLKTEKKSHYYIFSKLLYVISLAVRRVKFETILKYHERYLCQISRTNHAIIRFLYYYPQRFVIFTCIRYFKLN